MKAVFSFWDTTGNALLKATNWGDPKYHLYSWVVAVHQAKKYFDEVELITDSVSKPLFERLQLPFDSIRTDLDELINYPKHLWALGKVKAYQLQDRPFVHLDSDFFVMRPLRDDFLKADVGFQNVEPAEWFNYSYRKQYNELSKLKWKPEFFGIKGKNYDEWKDYAVNCGIYYCNNLEFNKRYTQAAFDWIDKNSYFFKNRADGGYCLLFEQYLAATYIEGMSLKASYMVDWDKLNTDAGFVHLWGGSKRENKNLNNLDIITKHEFKYHYELINRILTK